MANGTLAASQLEMLTLSGTGVITIVPPNTNTNRTLTLPDVTDTVAGIAATQTLTNKTLTSPTLTTPNINSAQFATVSGTAPLYAARAWVNFNGTGTPAIRASGNVTSITDNGTGDYTVNFTTAMSDADYSYSLSTRHQVGVCRGIVVGSATTAPQTGSFRIENYDFVSGAFGAKDVDYICVSIFR